MAMKNNNLSIPMKYETSEEWYKEISRIKEVRYDDFLHDTKRVGSLLWFDKMLQDCKKNICPNQCFDPNILYALIDISIEGYTLEKLNEHPDTIISLDDNKVSEYANEITDIIFNCKNTPSFDREIFVIDSKEVTSENDCYTTYHGSRNRKAYWTYLKGIPDNYHYTDYCSACGFIEVIHHISNKESCKKSDLNAMKKILRTNPHIANPLDLYRFCIVREKLIESIG
jgi:hypothetical protein